jgi:CO dehydrogenase/acetyl-CoA synthase beta subunit
MKSEKKEKTFDAVKMMREIRDKISAETQGMSFEELKAYIRERLEAGKVKPVGK